MSGVSRFVSDSIITLLLAIFNRGIGIGAGIVLARYLGPAGKGYVAYAPVALELFVTAMNGVAQAVTVQYGRDRIAGSAVHHAMMKIVLWASIPAALALAVAARVFPSQQVLMYAAIALPFAMYTTAATGMLIGADRISATNIQRTIIATGFNAVTVFVVVFGHAEYHTVLAVWVASYAGAAAYSYIALHPYTREAVPATAAIVRAQLSFGATSGIAQLAGYLNMRIDIIIVSFALGVRAVGLYTLAVGLAELLWQLSSPMCMSAFPRMATGDPVASAAFTAKLVRHALTLMVPVGLLCFIAGPPLIALLYGRAFEPSGEALRWILPGVVAYAVEIPLGYYLMVRLGKPWLVVAIQSASIVACAALTLATVGRFGINGAAAATSVTYIAVVLTKGAIFARATKIAPRDLLFIKRDDIRGLREIARRLIARAIPARAA